MGMSIDDLKAYCMEQEHNHRLDCKRYDDASGYTRSKNKDIRTACAIREELLGDYYQQIAQTLRKYQMMQADHKADMVDMLTEIQAEIEKLDLEDSIPSYTRGAEDTRDYIANMLEERIDKLKGETE